MKNILLKLGHPRKDSFNAALMEAYKQAAIQSGYTVEEIFVSDLKLNLNEVVNYKNPVPDSPEIAECKLKISRANHLVFFHPLWWGGVPAVMKDFIDKTFTPGFAFKYRKDSVWWDKLLTGKTARIVCTADQPYFYYRWINGKPAINQLKKMTLEFCGIKPVKVSWIAPIKRSSEEQKLKRIESMVALGQKGA